MLLGLPPRRPSERVRAALFHQAPTSAAVKVQDALPATHRLQVWFAPLAAAAVVVLSLAPVLLPAAGPVTAEFAFAALDGPWQPNALPLERNAPPTPTFHSTFGAAVTPSFGSLLLRQTNILAR